MTSLKTMMVVSDPAIAAFVAEAGLDRLFVDLEVHGKAARQPGDTWKSALTLADIPPIRAAAPGVEMMVRVNPLHPGTGEEIDGALAAGADILMLPMVRTLAEIARFHDLLAARAPFIPLLETAAGVALVAEILAGPRPAEVYFGLNDLSLDLGRDFMFEPLAEGMLDAPAALLCAAGVPFGLGGVARVGTGAVPAEMVLGEHVRLGSDRVILSRGFHDRAATVAEMRQNLDFRGELSALKAAYAAHTRADPGHLAQNRAAFQAAVAAVAAKMR